MRGGEHEEIRLGSTGIFIRSMLAGGVASSVATTVMAPVERVKLILQIQAVSKHYRAETHYKGLMDALVRIPREQGVLSFWRGNLASVMRGFPYMALNFAFHDKFKDYFTSGVDKKTHFWRKVGGNLLVGGLAGSTSMALIYPLDYARTRMAMDFGRSKATREFRSIRHCLSSAFQREGIRGLYRGLSFSLLGVFIYRGAYFGLFDTGKDMIGDQTHSLFYSLLVAEVASTASGLLSYPFDTVRRSMMIMEGTKYHHTTTRDCIKRILCRKGIRGFYNGALTNVIRGTGGAIMLVLYDQIQETWKPPQF